MTDATSQPTDEPTARQAWRTLLWTSTAAFMVLLDATFWFGAFPNVRRSFPAVSVGDLSSILNAYTVVYAALLAPAGRIADRVGRKRVFLCGVAVFAVGSLACLVAPIPLLLIGGRMIQAVGGAMLTPSSLALILSAFPRRKWPLAVSIWVAWGALAVAVGPSLGAAIIQFGGWRWTSLINLPIGIVVWRWGRTVLAESPLPMRRRRPDLAGIALLIISVGLIALGIARARDWRALTVAWAAAGLMFLGWFVSRSLQVRVPAFERSLFRVTNFRYANLGTLVFGAAFSGMLVTTVLFLCGCAVGPRFRRPSTTVAQQWSVDQGGGTNTREPAEQWWVSFNDREFDKLVRQAVQANLDLKLAAARVGEARAERGVAKSGLFPAVDATASATRNRQRTIAPPTGSQRSALLVPIEFNNFQGGFDASWELDVFGRIRSGLRAANADVATAAEARRAVLVTVLGDIGRSYAELRGFQLRLDIAQKNINTQEDTLELTRSQAAAGLATELDVARALAQLETTRSVVPTLQSGIETSIHRLSVLLGEEPGALRAELLPGAPVPLTPAEVPVGLPSELLERRPDIRQAEAQIAAATARVGEAKAGFFPRFLLLGSAGRQASQLHDLTLGMGNFFSAGPAISLPLFTGGRIRSQVRVQDARLQGAVISYRSTVLTALEETEDALVNYAQEQARHERLETAVKSNEEAVQLSSELYKAGLTDFLSVLDAQRELYANEDLLAQSRTTQTLNLIALYKALGGGWQSFPQP